MRASFSLPSLSHSLFLLPPAHPQSAPAGVLQLNARRGVIPPSATLLLNTIAVHGFNTPLSPSRNVWLSGTLFHCLFLVPGRKRCKR